MGTQFTPNSIPRNIIIIMKFLLVVLSLVASAIASPIEVTPEVAEATAAHLAAHAAATAGEHAALAPAVVATSYLADAEDVAAAKAEFEKLFKAAEAGTPIIPALPEAPVAVAAPVATALPAHYYGLGAYNGYPYAGVYGGYYNGLYNGVYNGVYNGLYNGLYAHGYTGYPFNYLPYQLTAPVVAEAKSE